MIDLEHVLKAASADLTISNSEDVTAQQAGTAAQRSIAASLLVLATLKLKEEQSK